MDSISTKAKDKSKAIETTSTDPVEETSIEKAPEVSPEKQTEASEEVVETRAEDSKAEIDPNSGTEEQGQDSYESLFPEPTVVIGSPPNWIWWVIIIIVTVIISAIGFKLLDKKLDQWLGSGATATPTAKIVELETPTIYATPTPTASASATPTPEATPTASQINKSSISIRVLNGTSIAGAATKIKTTLEKAGFTVRTVGNATKNNYQETIVYYQAGKSSEADLVKASLNDENSRTEQSDLANPDNILVVYGTK